MYSPSVEITTISSCPPRERTVSKWYLALCIGVPEQSSFEVRVPIGRHPTELVARVAVQGGGTPARDSSGEEEVEEDESEEGNADLGSSGRPSAAADSDVKQAWTSFRVVASNPDIDLTALAKPGEWQGHSLVAYLDVVIDVWGLVGLGEACAVSC